MPSENTTLADEHVAEFLDLAESAHIYFDVINDRLTMRAVNPIWEMWRPFRYLLDEIGSERIATYIKSRRGSEPTAIPPWRDAVAASLVGAGSRYPR